VIGVAKYSHNDARGFWFTVRFDASEPLAKRILNADPDIVRASSGAIGHLVRTGEAGIIEVWPVGELALFDTNEWRKPANELAVFMAKAEITEAATEAETQAAAVDEAEPKVKSLIMEKKPMEEEIKEPTQESAIDLDSLVSKLDAISAKLEKLENAPPINAPAIVKSENLGSPDPVRAFAHYLITGEKVKGLKAALGENTAGVGGYLVPEDSYTSIVEKRNELSIPRRAGATIFQTNRDVFNIQVESTSQTYYAQAAHDMAAVSEDEPTFGNLSGVVYPFTKLVKVSVDLLEDNASNLSQFLTNSFARWAG
jgi:HK97 family phage major capsid protein